MSLNNVQLGASPVSLTSSGLSVSFSVGISVANPNFFNVDFTKITAKARYPGVDSDLGGGTLNNVNFKGHTESTFDFPFSFNYTTAADPNQVILRDLLAKCGGNGGAAQDITIDYDLDLQLKILGVSIDPKLSSSASFTCPISADDLQVSQLVQSALKAGHRRRILVSMGVVSIVVCICICCHDEW